MSNCVARLISHYCYYSKITISHKNIYKEGLVNWLAKPDYICFSFV